MMQCAVTDSAELMYEVKEVLSQQQAGMTVGWRAGKIRQ